MTMSTLSANDAGGERGMSSWRKLRFFLLTLCWTVPLLTCLLEVSLWVFKPEKFHEWAVWIQDGHIQGRMLPGQLLDNARGCVVRINKYGFRGPDYTYEKPPGTLRVEVFAGSSAFEYFSGSDEKSWPGALEKKLKERLHMPVEVINLSLPGFDTYVQKINYMGWGRAFNPDAIIVYEMFNDMTDQRLRKIDQQPYFPQGPAENRPWWMRLARMTQIGRRMRKMLYYVTDRVMEGKYRRIEGTAEGFDKPLSRKAYAYFKKNLQDFYILSKSDGVLMIIASQAFLGSKDNLKDPLVEHSLSPFTDRNGMTLPRMVEVYDHLTELERDAAKEWDVPFVDGYHAVPHDLKHIRDDVHFYDLGSEVLAETCATTLMADARFMKVVERVRAEKRAAN